LALKKEQGLKNLANIKDRNDFTNNNLQSNANINNNMLKNYNPSD
jgi:hypothetical protein